MRGLLRELKEERRAVIAMLKEGIDDEIDTALKKGLDSLIEAFNKGIEDGSDAVIKRFDDLYDTLMGTDWESRRAGKKSIPEMLAEAVGDEPAPSFVPPGFMIAREQVEE